MHTAIHPIYNTNRRLHRQPARQLVSKKLRSNRPTKVIRKPVRAKDIAYKTATGENFLKQLEKSGLTFEQLIKRSLSGLHYEASQAEKKRVEQLRLGQGQEFTVYRIPIKGFEGYALRIPSQLHKGIPDIFNAKEQQEIGLNKRLTLYNHPLAKVCQAGVPLCGARINPFTSLQVVRLLPGTDFVPPKKKGQSDLKRTILAHKMLGDMPQEAFNQLARICFKMSDENQRFDPCLGNFINLQNKRFGVIDTIRDYEHWQDQMLGVAQIPLVSLKLLMQRLKEKDLLSISKPLFSIADRLSIKVKRAIKHELNRQRKLYGN